MAECKRVLSDNNNGSLLTLSCATLWQRPSKLEIGGTQGHGSVVRARQSDVSAVCFCNINGKLFVNNVEMVTV